MKKGKILIGAVCAGILLCSALAAMVFYKPQKMRADYERLQTDEYNGLFLSSFPITEYSEEVFSVYRGVPTVIAQFPMRRMKDYADYFNVIWDSGNVITNIYMGMDPYEIWLEAGKKEDKWNQLLDEQLIRYITAHQDVCFDILLPYDSLASWREIEAYEERLQVYASFIDKLDDYANVTQFFLGGEEWLIANPQNYAEHGITPELAEHISLLTFCDREYVIAAGNAEILLGRVRELLAVPEASDSYGDYSDYAFVFFGDSIIATATGSYSIPGIVQGLTDARGYNMAVGGSSASAGQEGDLSLSNVVQAFFSEKQDFWPESNFAVGLKKYIEEDTHEKKHIFFLNYGLNDYFSGKLPDNPEDSMDVSTYAGALRKGITLLQEHMPDAEIVLMAPTYTAEFSGGTEDLSGHGYVLTDYVEAARNVAEQMRVSFLDNYTELGIGSGNYTEYLADGCHPNDKGRFLFAKNLVMYLESLEKEMGRND